MRSVTSCFNATLYKKDLTRFWPMWVLYTVIWLFMFPLNLFSQSIRYGFDPTNWVGREPITLVAQGGGLAISACYGLLCAAAVWSYLYNNRSANLMHALPIRRDGHFLTHTLAGITFFLLPHIIVFLTTLVAEVLCGRVNVTVLATAMFAQTLMCLFFFCFATLCAMLTGHLLGLPAFYGIFNGIVWVMAALVEWLCNFFLYGYSGGFADSVIVRTLTPIWLIAENVRRRIVYRIDQATGEHLIDPLTGEHLRADYYAMDGLGLLCVLALVSVVMLGIALLLYRKRHMESAGDTVSVPALRPVFLYCMGICGSLAGGCVIYLMFELESLIFLVFALMLWGVIFYFAGMMLLHKTFRVFKQGWWGCCASLCAVLALCGCLQIDLFGMERRVPNVEQVETVTFSGLDTVPYDRGNYIRGDSEDPEVIAKVIAVHQSIVDDRKYLQDWQEAYADRGYRFTKEQQQAIDEGLAQTANFNVTYTLKNGSYFSRNYNYLFLEYGKLGDPTSLETIYTELANDRDTLAERYRMIDLEKGTLQAVAITDSGTHNCVYLKDPWLRQHYSVPRYYPEQGDEFYLAVLEKYGFTREELENDPMLLEKLLMDPEMSYMIEDYIAGVEWTSSPSAAPVPTVTVESSLSEGLPYGLTEGTLTEEQAEAIKQAVLDDFYAGNIGVRYLFNGAAERQDNTFVADLEIFYETVQYEYYYDGNEQQAKPYTTTNSFKITLTPQAKNTIAALKAAGAFADTGVELRTNSGTLYNP